MYGKSRAFSLVELLISLIIISCVIAAFAPIMTKRHSIASKDGYSSVVEVLLTSESKGKNEQYYLCNEDITVDSDGSRYLNCKLKNLPDKINAVIVGAGGAGADSTGGSVSHVNKEITYNSSDIDKKLSLTKNIKNLKFTLVAAGGSGGG